MCTTTNLNYLNDFFGSEQLTEFIQNNYNSCLSSKELKFLFVDYDDYDLLKLNKLIFSYKVIRGQLKEKFDYLKMKNHHFRTFCVKLMKKVESDEKFKCREFMIGEINKYLKDLEDFYANKLIEGNTKNKEKSKEYATCKTICECGAEITKGNLAKHKRSPKHITFMNNLTNNDI